MTAHPKSACLHDGEQADVSTYGDLGRATRQLLCTDCGGTREESYDWHAHFGMPRPEEVRL